MKMLVTGATGYLGAVAADALAIRGHQVLGLARSERSANTLRERGIEPVVGDFGDPARLANAVREAKPDVVVSTASVGGASGDQAAFARDGEAVRAMREALTDHGGGPGFPPAAARFRGFYRGGGRPTCRFRHRFSRPHPPGCTRCWPAASRGRWPLASRPNGPSWPTGACAGSSYGRGWSTDAAAIPTSGP